MDGLGNDRGKREDKRLHASELLRNTRIGKTKRAFNKTEGEDCLS